MIYNINGDDKFSNIFYLFKKNLPHHPPLLFIETLDYLTKESEKLHILLFIEFSEKTIDQLFEKIQQTKEILKFFVKNKNVFFSNYIHHCIEIFRSFKSLNFIVKSAVLDQYNTFLSDLSKNNISNFQKNGFQNRPNKRSSTPNLVLSMFENKYRWNIKAKNSSISPSSTSSERRQFFADNRYHKKKNSSFEINAKKCKNNINFHEKEALRKKTLFISKINRIEKQLLQRKLLISYFKQTHELLNTLNENLKEEAKALHFKLNSNLKASYQNSLSLSNFPLANNLEQLPLEIILKSSQDSVKYCSNIEELSSGQIEVDFEEFQCHQKNSSQTNKLSFGLKTLSFEKFDVKDNVLATSPKFEGSESNKSFTFAVNQRPVFGKNNFNQTQVLEVANVNNNPFSFDESPCNNARFFEEKALIMKNSEVLFKEKFESSCMKGYKPKPTTKKSVNRFSFFKLFFFIVRRSIVHLL